MGHNPSYLPVPPIVPMDRPLPDNWAVSYLVVVVWCELPMLIGRVAEQNSSFGV